MEAVRYQPRLLRVWRAKRGVEAVFAICGRTTCRADVFMLAWRGQIGCAKETVPAVSAPRPGELDYYGLDVCYVCDEPLKAPAA